MNDVLQRGTRFVPLILETQVFRQTLLHHLDELVALVTLRALHDPVVVRRRRFELAVKRTDATAQSSRRRHAVGGLVVVVVAAAVGRHHRRRPVVPVVMLRFVGRLWAALAFPITRRVSPSRRRRGVTVLRRRRRRLSDGKRHFDGSLSAHRRHFCRRPVHGFEYFRRQSLDVLRRNGNVGLNSINRKRDPGLKTPRRRNGGFDGLPNASCAINRQCVCETRVKRASSYVIGTSKTRRERNKTKRARCCWTRARL